MCLHEYLSMFLFYLTIYYFEIFNFSQQKTLIMKKLIVLLFSSFFLISLSAEATFVVVYGKGGVVNNPDGSSHICPDQSDKKCASISLPTTGTDGIMTVDGMTYNVEIIEMSIIGRDGDDFYCNGVIVNVK